MNRIYKIILGSILLSVIILNCTKPGPSTTFKPLIEKYVEFWNTGSFNEIETILHPDFELRTTPKFEAETGIAAFKESISKTRESYPDFHITIEEVVYGNNIAAGLWTIHATSKTGKKNECNGN